MLRGFWTVLATGCTLAVIGLSMAMNFSFGYGLGTSEANARILGALSVACDGLKALLPLFVAWQWTEGHRLAAAVGALLFVLLLAYGTASAIGFAAENRTALTSTRDSRKAVLDAAVAGLAAAEARLAALPAHRLQGVIDAEIAASKKDRIWDATLGCTDATLPTSREFCKRIDHLSGERAVAAKAAVLATAIERLKVEVRRGSEAGAARESDPQAHAITQLTGLDAASVRSGLTWLLALAVEAISAFGLFAITRRRPEAASDAQHDLARRRPRRLAARTSPEQQIEPGRGWRLLKAG